MAKMFYTLDEAGRKLGRTADQVRKMVESGQLQEFRDGDSLVVKREQVEAMISDDADAPITLADSGEISLADSAGGSGTGAGESTKERSGISIFEADELDNTADASAQTQVTSSVGGIRVPDAGGSGSGLLDLTRDSSEDTGIGAGLMADVYNSGDSADVTPAGARSGGGLFESTGASGDGGMAAPMMVYAEPIDGVGSGMAGGLAFGMIAALLLALFAVIAGLAGAGASITGMGSSMFWGLIGAAAGITLIGAGIGAFIGSRNK
ncbi:MAG: hypothetical protein K2X91_12375 [Thermoleophilia bacterium]|nr:hypothetical protein [Thermoleophilia bacterium]